MIAPPPIPSALDANQVLQHSFEDATGRLRVAAELVAGGTSEVIISHVDDSIRLGNGVSLITATSVAGSIGLDVNIINPAFPVSLGQKTMANSFPVVLASNQSPIAVTFTTVGDTVTSYSEITAIAAATETTILTYAVGVAQAYLLFVESNGTNVADYKVKLNGSTINRKYTYFGAPLSAYFDFKSSVSFFPGLSLVSGDVLTVTVIHNRPSLGDFNANIEIFEA